MSSKATLNEDQRDCLQEICNVAMGQAADSLARLLDAFIHLSIPAIHAVPAERLDELLDPEGEGRQAVGVQDFRCADTALSGRALVRFPAPGLTQLEAVLAAAGGDAAEPPLGLAEVTGVLAGTCVGGIMSQLCGEVELGEPRLLDTTEEAAGAEPLGELLLVAINYQLESGDFSCDLLLLMSGSACAALAQRLDEQLEDL